jgi:hypothetical protein
MLSKLLPSPAVSLLEDLHDLDGLVGIALTRDQSLQVGNYLHFPMFVSVDGHKVDLFIVLIALAVHAYLIKELIIININMSH